MLTVLAGLAEFERELIKTRTSASQERDALVARAGGGEQVSAAEALKAAAQVEKPTPSDEKSDPPQPDGPAEAPAAPKPADPSDDEPQAADLHGSVDDDDLFSDYFVELERGIAALQKAWLHAPAEARGYFLAWVASGWRPPQGR